MEYLRIKNSDICVSRICIGGDPMGGHAWGKTDEGELIGAVDAGIDAGINFFDTADIYGLGNAETLLGKALAGKRDKVVIASKFGVRRTSDNQSTYYDNSPAWIRTAIEGSLKRLRTDYIDIYQIHYPDGKTPMEEIVDTLERLKRDGKVRYFGLSNVTEQDLEILLPYRNRFVSFQNQYSLACRDYEQDIKMIAEQMYATPLTWGSLGQGVLTGKYGRNVVFGPDDRRSRVTYPNFHGEKLQKNLDIVDEMIRLGQVYGKKPAAMAIRFILDYLPESAVLVGVKRKEQVMANCEACGWKLSPEHMERLDMVSK